MFTGIIEEVGRVEAIERTTDSIRMKIKANTVVSDVSHGHSISVNGVCLTVTGFDTDSFTADVMQVTLDYTTLGEIEVDAPVNLERAMAANGRFGGHIVQGHVDGTATLDAITESTNWHVYRFNITDDDLAQYIVKKGSVAINGTSLTVAECKGNQFEVSLIPTTLAETTLGSLNTGDRVNVECDVLAKYVRSMNATN